jgi:secreted trypsin-like serine protease
MVNTSNDEARRRAIVGRVLAAFLALVVVGCGDSRDGACAFATDAGPDSEVARKVFGGRVVDISETPWLVTIREGSRVVCSGALLDSHTVLTAAHCVAEREPTQVSVVAGTERRDGAGGTHHDVLRIDRAEAWRPGAAWELDVALLWLAIPVETTAVFARLASDDELDAALDAPQPAGFVAGWGLTESGVPDSLRGTEVSVLDACAVADEDPRWASAWRELLAISSERGVFCRGDSGSPVQSAAQPGVVLGVASFNGTSSAGRCTLGSAVSARSVRPLVEAWVRRRM